MMKQLAIGVVNPRLKRKKSKIGLIYIMPWIIGFLAFQAYPIVSSLFYSFTDFNLYDAPRFIGFENYERMFSIDQQATDSLWITFVYVLYTVPLKLLFALFIALLLNSKVKGIGFFRTAYYLPSILGGSVAIAMLWRFLFVNDGTVNAVLGLFGIEPVGWLSTPGTDLFTLSLLAVWQFGSSMVLFLAGLKQIPSELYEAGRIDGASRPRLFFKITLPMLSPILFFNLVMQMVNAFQEFTAAFIITPRGGPLKSTYLYVMKLFDEGFNYYKMGYAAALSWVLFVIIIIATVIAFATSDRWVYYTDEGGRK
jgi:oligogalacturonide transport system permease protein